MITLTLMITITLKLWSHNGMMIMMLNDDSRECGTKNIESDTWKTTAWTSQLQLAWKWFTISLAASRHTRTALNVTSCSWQYKAWQVTGKAAHWVLESVFGESRTSTTQQRSGCPKAKHVHETAMHWQHCAEAVGTLEPSRWQLFWSSISLATDNLADVRCLVIWRRTGTGQLFFLSAAIGVAWCSIVVVEKLWLTTYFLIIVAVLLLLGTRGTPV